MSESDFEQDAAVSQFGARLRAETFARWQAN